MSSLVPADNNTAQFSTATVIKEHIHLFPLESGLRHAVGSLFWRRHCSAHSVGAQRTADTRAVTQTRYKAWGVAFFVLLYMLVVLEKEKKKRD